MYLDLKIDELSLGDWQRLRDIRLASLLDTPEAYGERYEVVVEFGQDQWLERMSHLTFLIAVLDDKDSAIMSVEELQGDFGATIWLGGCWVAPEFRGQGIMKAMIGYVDSVAQQRGWHRQGLGVWHDNYAAIAAYERLGFVKLGDLQESTRKPGMYFQRMFRDTPTFD